METTFFGAAFFAYLLATILGVCHMALDKKLFRTAGMALSVVGFILHTVALILRTVEAGHAPCANLYESLVFFSFVIVLIYQDRRTPGAGPAKPLAGSPRYHLFYRLRRFCRGFCNGGRLPGKKPFPGSG